MKLKSKIPGKDDQHVSNDKCKSELDKKTNGKRVPKKRKKDEMENVAGKSEFMIYIK